MLRKNYPARVLVTGAAGFIGSHVVDRLLADGCVVWGVDNFDPFYDRVIKESNLEAARAEARFEFREGDLRDGVFVEELLAEATPGAVVHLAARAGVRPSIEEPETYYEINVMGTVRLLDAMRRSDIKSLVFASSSSVYGASTENRPFSEEDVSDKPISPYAATKRAGELLCHTYHQLHGLSCCSLRFFTVYGPRQRPDLAIHKFTRAIARGEAISIYGDGGALRDYTYVSDTVDGVCRALLRISDPTVDPTYEVYNLGAGRMVSVNELVTLLARAMGVQPLIERAPAQPGDVPRTWANISKARQALGYEPGVSIEEGLTRFVSWYREVNGLD